MKKMSTKEKRKEALAKKVSESKGTNLVDISDYYNSRREIMGSDRSRVQAQVEDVDESPATQKKGDKNTAGSNRFD